jgi:hypothetical protein
MLKPKTYFERILSSFSLHFLLKNKIHLIIFACFTFLLSAEQQGIKTNQVVLQEEKTSNNKKKNKSRNLTLTGKYKCNKHNQHKRQKQEQAKQAHQDSNDTNDAIYNIHYPALFFVHNQELDQIFSDSTLDFETACKTLKHSHCQICRSTSLKLVVHNNICTTCKQNNRIEEEYREYLPIWYEDPKNKQTARFDVPTELSCLREGEKLLLQQISCYVPLQHLSKGQIGSKGHVCCFEQAIDEICKVLPRLPSDVKFIRVIKQYRKEGGDIGKTTFCIRRNVVLKALYWLKEYNIEYKDIIIQEANLDWIKDGEEQDLPSSDIELEAEAMEVQPSQDLGPSISQATEGLSKEDEEEETVFGILPGIAPHLPKEKDSYLTQSLQEATEEGKKHSNKATINFPYVNPKPVSEYDTQNGLFAKAFPWLFPGGRGDFYQFRNNKLSVSEWVKNLVLYEDGRFAKDRMWGFYVLNFATRKKNQTSGGYFVDSFFKEGPKNLEDLKAKIQSGDTSWIDRICYYSKLVVGSPGYWRSKRAELYSWIQHHVEEGHGPPTFFMTFSCAEYQWQDIKRLVTDRFESAGLPIPDFENTSFVRLVNDYTIIIQEYFQQRIQLWLDTVGKKVFGIKYYWLRFEFAPSRGQIHTHMLAIHEDPDVLQEYHRLRDNKLLQALYLQEWAERSFGMTASLPKNAQLEKTHGQHPASQYYSELTDIERDKSACLVRLQNHQCNGFCMKPRRYM